MKSVITTAMLVILLASGYVNAQTRIGISAGPAFASITAKSEGISISSPKLKLGFTAGLFADAPLSSNFSFHPEVNFVQKGSIWKEGSEKDKLDINYIEVPMNFVYNVTQHDGFFIGAGPSLGIAISGREKYTDKDYPENNSNDKITFGSSEDDMKRTDFGANFLAGYKLAGGITIAANYNLGLGNIANKSDVPEDDGTVRNRYFSIKIGYMFGGQKHK
jgi:hypothetical protein